MNIGSSGLRITRTLRATLPRVYVIARQKWRHPENCAFGLKIHHMRLKQKPIHV